MLNAFVAWSGGKDCCQAAYQAQQQGFQIRYLLNMVNREVPRSCSHGITTSWIRLQAEAMGIPIMQQSTAGKDYEDRFIEALRKLKNDGITHGIFGDIDFEPHREWNEKVCRAAGIAQVLPLWQLDQGRIARDFIELGFESVIITTRADLLGEKWLGRKFDSRFLKDLADYPAITPCGEAGEFHTLVIDGPLFQKRLVIKEAAPVKRENYWFLDIQSIDLVEK
jgi:diphthine-ammonia ligase